MNLKDLLKKPYMTPILLGIIAILLICIIVLLLTPGRGRNAANETNSDLQQNITNYAETQKQKDNASGLSGETVSIEPVEEQPEQNGMLGSGEEIEETEESELIAADTGKTAVVIDEEDVTDVSYSKEYILNEAYPYFEDNNHAAIWDLAHLKRYVKLSSELKGTNQFYYKGDINSAGRPDGKGLAIYEDNSYYYGEWSDGVRNGDGRWFRFYIGEVSKRNALGKYTSHSYAGEWSDDLPNGQGAEHFDVDVTKIKGNEEVIQNVVGGFSNGLYDGDMFANTVDYTGSMDEWNGVAVNGVFDLWKDMSSIGECSVWRNKDNEERYLDIDKSENKNQGIRELLQLDTKQNDTE